MPHYTGELSRSWLIIPLLFLYLYGLGGTGFLGPDEPRYVSIGRAMSESHDFVTPRLDGQPWFEKPPLLYWMVAAGRALRLSDEWAARLPGALLSAGFLIFFFASLAREFSTRTAIAATTMLATMAGWLGFSFAAVTDLPMSATFWIAMLIAMYDTRREQGYVAGALLGLSVLAKGLVPLVLFVPVLLIAGAIIIAAPWYLLVWMRNGRAAMDELIVKHHFERFVSASLQHVQPRWFYAPILLAGIFPWTPMAALLVRRKTFDDVRVRFLTAWLIYAFVFFSASVNKLPGYVLPLLPALAIVFAVGLERSGADMRWLLAASALLLTLLPTLAAMAPEAFLSGIRKAPVAFAPALPFVLVAGVVLWLAWRDRPNFAILAIGIAVVFAMTYVKVRVLPQLDQRVSVRAFWRAHEKEAANACLEGVRREWVYGLNYYAHRPLPACSLQDSMRIVQENGKLALKIP